MTELEIVFAVIGVVLSVIGIVVGIIGAYSIKISTNNKNKVKNINNSDVKIDNSITNGITTKELTEFTSKVYSGVQELYERQAEINRINFSDILKETVILMKNEGIASTVAVDETWSLKFFEYAGNASNKDIQMMWAKLLKAKMSGKSDTSMRTLEILSNLSPDEALTFEKMTDYVLEGRCIIKKYLEDNKVDNFDEIQTLKESGLLSTEPFLTYHKNFNNNSASISNGNLIMLVSPKKNQTEITFEVYSLTRAGEEIYRSLGKAVSDVNLKSIAKWIKTNNTEYNVSLHQVNFINGGQINYNLNDIINL